MQRQHSLLGVRRKPTVTGKPLLPLAALRALPGRGCALSVRTASRRYRSFWARCAERTAVSCVQQSRQMHSLLLKLCAPKRGRCAPDTNRTGTERRKAPVCHGSECQAQLAHALCPACTACLQTHSLSLSRKLRHYYVTCRPISRRHSEAGIESELTLLLVN